MLTGLSCAIVSRSVNCGHIGKHTLRRFSSNLLNVDCSKSASELTEGKATTRSARKRKQLIDNRHSTVVPAAFESAPKKNETVRVLDKNTAKDIALLTYKVLNSSRAVLEFDAGSGILSTALLERGMKKVVAFESHSRFESSLQEIKDKHKSRFNFYSRRIDDILLCSEKDILEQMPDLSNHEEDQVVQIIGQVCNVHLLLNIARRTRDVRSFLRGKRVNLCLILPSSTWKKFSDPKYYGLSIVQRILFMLTFRHRILGTFKKSGFHICMKKRNEMKLDPNEDFVMVHIKSKRNKIVDIAELEIFLTQFHNYKSRKRLVIPSLEQWSPSCGEDLVRKGMPCFTRFSDLTPEQLVEVFRFFKTLPNVEASGFLSEWRNYGGIKNGPPSVVAATQQRNVIGNLSDTAVECAA